ncbi:MAG: hypothetical protein LQ338_004621 [Usnochroma carphineum]|nr:MAG: hypothetical protein LQ338_004621 [Usnochroma carphineum]
MAAPNAGSPGDVPPYEPNPSFTQQPQMQHHDSYNNAPIQQYPQQQYQQQYQQQHQQQPMVSPPMDQQKHEYYPSQAATPQHQPSMPTQQPVQQPVQQIGYQTATPLQNLQEAAAPVDCPCCRMRALTRTEYHSGNTTNAWAALVCVFFCLGCIPYLLRSLKDVEHKCGNCGVLLATWHNSGRVVVHQHA